MKYALVKGIRIEATSKKMGTCPLCLSDVRGYAGKIVVNHWKQVSKIDCDNWHEPENF
jgi:competence CoiA-like predicted nuclease